MAEQTIEQSTVEESTSLEMPMEWVNSFNEKLSNGEYKVRIAEIRTMLENNEDAEGDPLETIELEPDLTEEQEEAFNDILQRYGLSVNEYIWLMLEEIIAQQQG